VPFRWPNYLREKVQSGLTLAWTFRMPVLQKTSPAQLVASTLRRVLASSVTNYTYVDFCAGAGGPTPFIERDLNAQLMLDRQKSSTTANRHTTKSSTSANSEEDSGEVKFVLTDLHPHIPEWTKAAAKSEHLSFVSKPVDATNAPTDLIKRDGKKTFRLFFLAFHHFDDPMARDILRNTLETADGFGYITVSVKRVLSADSTRDSIFELQERTISSIITVTAMGILMFFISPFYFWRSPGHLFFTYIIPLIPLILVLDGYVSSLRTRTSEEIHELMKECGASADGWTVKSGAAQHTWPTGYMTYVIGVKDRAKVQ
jgi:hypothetical protein